MQIVLEYVIVSLIFFGSVIALLGGIGVLRFPDFFSRGHAFSIVSTLASFLILFGVFLYFWLILDLLEFRWLLAIIFLYATSPLASHLLARAVYYKGGRPDHPVLDELNKEVQKKRQRFPLFIRRKSDS